MMIPLILHFPGGTELLIIVGAIVLLFGGRKIPEMMKGMGTGIREFKKGLKEDEKSSQSLPNEENKESTD